MIDREAAVIRSVEPTQGQEGTVVTLSGSGFATHIRNNCVVVGGMGACARPLPGSTPTELKVRIGPVARETHGDILMWPGTGADLYLERIHYAETELRFSEASLFRNGAPVTSAGVDFKLTKPSPDSYAGQFTKSPRPRLNLEGHELGSTMRVVFPKGLASRGDATSVDICVVLKEPTLAIDFTAAISGRERSTEHWVRAIAKAIVVNAGLAGERVFADVVTNHDTGDVELHVTKPYLSTGMVTVHFSPARS